MRFADVIVDISVEELDKSFQYIIPDRLDRMIDVGDKVVIPFGRTTRKGYVIGISDKPAIDIDRLKELIDIDKQSVSIDGKFIKLAFWMKSNYGSTMNHALGTVIPVKKTVKRTVNRTVHMLISIDEAKAVSMELQEKRGKAQARILEALIIRNDRDYTSLMRECNVSASSFEALENKGLIEIYSSENIRNDFNIEFKSRKNIFLNEEQQRIVDSINAEWDMEDYTTCLIKGVTGSGKTEVYMEIIQHVLDCGRQAIVLVPEIALTYQTVSRFYERFGKDISIIHSRLSQGERYDRFELAREGKIRIMIGPRTALFTPFDNLGLIIIDEEHENAYRSDTTPKFHARETAIELAAMSDAKVILGSATPSLESYYNAQNGIYNLYELTKRAGKNNLPNVCVADLREELKAGNLSVFSRALADKINRALECKEQVMLFLNRRGYHKFINCRDCGEVIECPHCAVSLTLHNNDKLICHYCGFERQFIRKCPKCNSVHIGTFKAGTQMVEEQIHRYFPNASVIRMDADSTKGKTGHEDIIQKFANGDADILIGTQMIVKGHDFPNVTVMGVLLADTSLYNSHYSASEQTFQLLTQAAGRAGRGDKPGEVVIQTYDPEHYAIKCALSQDYEDFYTKEIQYRTVMNYPPVLHMMSVTISSSGEEIAADIADRIKEISNISDVQIIGPAKTSIYKVKDRFYRIIYYKHKENKYLTQIKDIIEEYSKCNGDLLKDCQIQFDFR